jgi:uncharacterized protein (TIGR02118 family)
VQEGEGLVKAILGYDIVPGMSVQDYERWLKEVHLPDLSKVPGLKRVVLNTVQGLVRGETTFYRIAELHYESMEAFEKARAWREKNPVSRERSPEGKTDFKFYVVCESEEFDFGKGA